MSLFLQSTSLSIKNESNDGEGVRISNDTSLKIAKNHFVKILVKKIHGNGLNILKTLLIWPNLTPTQLRVHSLIPLHFRGPPQSIFHPLTLPGTTTGIGFLMLKVENIVVFTKRSTNYFLIDFMVFDKVIFNIPNDELVLDVCCGRLFCSGVEGPPSHPARQHDSRISAAAGRVAPPHLAAGLFL